METIEIRVEDIVEEIEAGDEFDIDARTRELDSNVAPHRRESLLLDVECRAADHAIEAHMAELTGDEERARDARDSCDDLRAFVQHVRRSPPPLPFGDTQKLMAIDG